MKTIKKVKVQGVQGNVHLFTLHSKACKLIITHSAGAFGSPSNRFTVKDYGSLKIGTGSKQCVAMKNGDASQTQCSNYTKTQCTSVRDLTKYTCAAPSHALRASPGP